MEVEIAAQLLALNEQFYQTFGAQFSSTRQRLQPGVRRILADLQGSENLLDLGCGNGEFARELNRCGHCGSYLGLDFSPVLLAAAGQAAGGQSFLQADLLSADWCHQVAARAAQPFDLVTAFSVLHHIPGRAARLQILQNVHALLVPCGRFIHSEWQFLGSEKLKSRIQPWELAGLSAAQVDAGDALLDWRAGGRGLRYVHHFSEAELDDLAQAAGFKILGSFLSDGRSGNLALYQVWERV